jgi:hypothetical protein
VTSLIDYWYKFDYWKSLRLSILHGAGAPNKD